MLAIFGFVILFASHQVLRSLFERHSWKGLDAGGWAAWVQAVGAIVAIYVPLRHLARQRERESADERASYLLTAVMHGMHARRILLDYCKLNENASVDPAVISGFASRISFPISALLTIPFTKVHAADARAISLSVILLSDVHGVFVFATQRGDKPLPKRINVKETNVQLATEMDKLCEAYKSITGAHPIPLPPAVETPGG